MQMPKMRLQMEISSRSPKSVSGLQDAEVEVKTIQLTKGYEALVDDEDYDWLSQWKWTARPSRSTVYAYR